MPKLKPNQFHLSGHLITERPLLFQTEMVQANLEDRKTQTRRVKKLDLINISPDIFKWMGVVVDVKNDPLKDHHVFHAPGHEDTVGGYKPGHIFLKCPYGKPGDLLWVRETWAKVLDTDSNPFYAHKADCLFFVDRWKPSIHMPKEAARLWLMVEDIRVERVQEINEKDAIAEGCSPYGPFGEFRGSPHPNGGSMKYRAYSKASRAFQCIWEEINGKDSWKSNPWVWVVTYRILSKTGRPSPDTILKNYLQITGKGKEVTHE